MKRRSFLTVLLLPLVPLGWSTRAEARARDMAQLRACLIGEDAYRELTACTIALSIDEKCGFVYLKRAAALKVPVLRIWTKAFDNCRSSLAACLDKDEPEYLSLFIRRAALLRLEFQESILRHLSREGDAYAKEVYNGILTTELKSATAQWDNPEAVANSVMRITHAVANRAERYAWPAEYTKLVTDEQASKVHSAVAVQDYINRALPLFEPLQGPVF